MCQRPVTYFVLQNYVVAHVIMCINFDIIKEHGNVTLKTNPVTGKN